METEENAENKTSHENSSRKVKGGRHSYFLTRRCAFECLHDMPEAPQVGYSTYSKKQFGFVSRLNNNRHVKNWGTGDKNKNPGLYTDDQMITCRYFGQRSTCTQSTGGKLIKSGNGFRLCTVALYMIMNATSKSGVSKSV